MWKTRLAIGFVAGLALAGCSVRSISNSGYGADRGPCASGSNPFYQGELSEFDVLGIDPAAPVDDAQIRAAAAQRKAPDMPPAGRVLLVQSGAPVPDEPMRAALERHYAVGTFSGVPPGGVPLASARTASAQEPPTRYAPALRLAAARGGYDTLVVYWGWLETAQQNMATRTVSWVPVVGWMLPDERQRMRIRLKFAVVDVASGAWDTYSPPPIEDQASSSLVSRKSSDQQQVELLKEQAYAQAATLLAARYSGRVSAGPAEAPKS